MGDIQQPTLRKIRKGATIGQLHHRTAYSMTIIIANMLYAEHQLECLRLLQVADTTQVYDKIRYLLAVSGDEKRNKRAGGANN